MPEIQTLSFPVNNWSHLYSLQLAIDHNQRSDGQQLQINGYINNHDFLARKKTEINIHFQQSNPAPRYEKSAAGAYILGEITLSAQQLTTVIEVDKPVFNELRKNLLEYADIDGIHIMLTLGLLCDSNQWDDGQTLKIVQLDYAMKGDG